MQERQNDDETVNPFQENQALKTADHQHRTRHQFHLKILHWFFNMQVLILLVVADLLHDNEIMASQVIASGTTLAPGYHRVEEIGLLNLTQLSSTNFPETKS